MPIEGRVEQDVIGDLQEICVPIKHQLTPVPRTEPLIAIMLAREPDNGTLYFAADDGTNGTELWTSDGTVGGTAMVTALASVGILLNIDRGSRSFQVWKKRWDRSLS